MIERTFRSPRPVHLGLTLGPLQRGRGDPTMQIEVGGVWRATRTPQGPATVHLTTTPATGEVSVRAWGPGAGWAAEAAPNWVGAQDDDTSFQPSHPLVIELARRLPGLRIPRTGAVVEALVPIILEQKVVGLEAKRSYHSLVRALGEPAPGPGRTLFVPPDPVRLESLPSYALHRFGIERRRAETIRRTCDHARRLEEAAHMAHQAARRRLTTLPGIGPWTAAAVALVALGDADAVPVGDYHLPHLVSWAFTGEPRGSDERMLELLAPYGGHRGRVIRLVVAGARRPARVAPRARLRAIASL